MKKSEFKDISLWEIFQEYYKGFMEKDFRLSSNYNIQRLWDDLQKLDV